jgi:hypothetical protein
MDSQSLNQITADVTRWLNDIVIGLNLCPFAKKPAGENTIAIHVVEPRDDEQLLELLADEMQRLRDVGPAVTETTLIVIPNLLHDFFDYAQFLTWANQMIKRQGFKGVFQLASFHPNYCFAGSDEDDIENYTNRSPYPIIHIIREASLAKAIEYFPNVEDVPEHNQATMRALGSEDIKQLFSYLKT